MESVLIITSSEKGLEFFIHLLSNETFLEISIANSGGEARRKLIERDFDLCIVDSPLKDEFGEALANSIVSKKTTQVILIVKNDFFDEISEKVENYGVLTVSKPINKNMFWSVLKLAKASHNKLSILKDENLKLIQKIEDIRIVNRAKAVLIRCLNISEEEAHKFIEKQAMNQRMSKKEIAEGILKTYDK